MNRLLTLLVTILIPALTLGQIQDIHISGTVKKYFDRNRSGPTLISAEIIDDFIYGRTLKVKIRGHRNSENPDLGFTFGAAAAVANHAATPFEMIWVEMDVRYKKLETTIAIAPAQCSVEAIVTKTRTFDSWWESCLEFL
ncbi:MAG: hypothetical protein L3J79_04135 [Candidatus Marinimicrobia bacterium]|nr:hypothetical protein [Candidatus Neomarinimicrobiota bacterium]